MTRLRQLMLGGLAALVMGGAVTSAYAEPAGSFQNRLNGATIGIPAGAAAPPGVYSGLETVYLGFPGSGTGNQGVLPAGALGCPAGAGASGCKLFLPAIANAVPIVWSTGWNFLGANFSMVAVQAWYMGWAAGQYPNLNSGAFNSSPVFGGLGNPFMVDANTFWSPINLSWNLGGGWFVDLSFNFTAPDGARYAGTPNPDYWTFVPAAAISYIGANWVGSANFFYDINTRTNSICCLVTAPVTGGNALYGDFFWTWKLGKWQIGPVAYFEAQTTADTGPGCVGGSGFVGANCGNLENVAVGGLVGYDFGPVDIQVWVTDSVWRQNAIDGVDVWTRLGFRIWAPEAPKPLVAKN
jgi:hypothetical protein